MRVIIALLRGVNVGGRNQVKMDALRTLCESLGLRDVQTYVQSGNIVFRSAASDLTKLSRRLEAAIEQACGCRPAVILRTVAELRDVIGRNPFAELAAGAPSMFLVSFLASQPDAAACDALHAIKIHPEQLRVDGREVYIHFPNGVGRSTLQLGLTEKTLKVAGTSRNWNTVTKLLEMGETLESASGVGSRASKRG